MWPNYGISGALSYYGVRLLFWALKPFAALGAAQAEVGIKYDQLTGRRYEPTTSTTGN